MLWNLLPWMHYRKTKGFGMVIFPNCFDDVLLLCIFCLIFLSIFLFLRLCIYEKQIKSIKDQIVFIEKEDTNLFLTTSFGLRILNEFAAEMNKILKKQRETERLLRNTNRNFKETITSISHDIRTPLTSAFGYIQMLQKEEALETEHKKYIRIISKRMTEVKEMLDQLFLFARIESGEWVIAEEKVNLNNLLYDAVSFFYEDYIAKGAAPEIQIENKPCIIQGDKMAVKRIFENVLSNSLIHGTGNYKIMLRKESDWVFLKFDNQTDSIELKEIDRIFERFYTTDQSRKKRTTGLGLSIAKHFTEQMGGKIQAELEGDLFSILIQFPVYTNKYVKIL